MPPPRKRARREASEPAGGIVLGSRDLTPDGLRKTCVGLWRENKFCDVKLVVGQRTFHAHRLVLAAASTFFHALVASPFTEGGEENIALPEISDLTFERVLEFIYARECTIDNESLLQPVLEAACRLQMDDLQAAAEIAVIQRITPASCLDAWDLADHFSLTALLAVAKKLALTRFDEVVESDAFPTVSSARLDELLASDALTLEREELAFHALARWVDAQPETPPPEETARLLSRIRFPLIASGPARSELEASPLAQRHPSVLAAMREEGGLENMYMGRTRKRFSMMHELCASYSCGGGRRDSFHYTAPLVITAKQPLLVSSLRFEVELKNSNSVFTLYQKSGDHCNIYPFGLLVDRSCTIAKANGECGSESTHVQFPDLRIPLAAGEHHTFCVRASSDCGPYSQVFMCRSNTLSVDSEPGFSGVAELKVSESQYFFPELMISVLRC